MMWNPARDLAHFGELNTGDRRSANNEQIDADLTHEYSNSPAGEI